MASTAQCEAHKPAREAGGRSEGLPPRRQDILCQVPASAVHAIHVHLAQPVGGRVGQSYVHHGR